MRHSARRLWHGAAVDGTGARRTERVAALLAAVLAAGVLLLYVRILQEQGDAAPPWVLGLFGVGVGAAAVSAARPATLPLVVALVVLGLLTVLALLSIGVLLLPSVALLGFVLVRRQG